MSGEVLKVFKVIKDFNEKRRTRKRFVFQSRSRESARRRPISRLLEGGAGGATNVRKIRKRDGRKREVASSGELGVPSTSQEKA